MNYIPTGTIALRSPTGEIADNVTLYIEATPTRRKELDENERKACTEIVKAMAERFGRFAEMQK
jgi:hypothetical protein